MRRSLLFLIPLLALLLALGTPAGAARNAAPPLDPPDPDKEAPEETGVFYTAPPGGEDGRAAALLNVTHVYTNSVPQAIADNSCITVTLDVPDSFYVGDLNVGLWITHTYRSDLDIWLHSPAGTVVDLLTDPDGGADHLNVLVDQASPNVPDSVNHTAPPPWYYAWWHPDGDLNAVRLQNAQGQWSLQVCDDAAGDSGTFNTATLFFETGMLALDPPAQNGHACAGGDVSYPVTLINTTGVTESFALSYTGNWPAGGPASTPVIPSPGEFTFMVTVRIPPSIRPMVTEPITITATGTSGTAQATVTTGADLISGYQDLANTPRPVRNESVVFWDGKLYKIGGYDGAAQAYLDIYDIATDTWTPGADMPGARYWIDCVAIAGKIYCAGGYLTSGQTTLYIYDIATSAWSTGAAMSAYRYSYAGAALNGKYYVIGGYGAGYPATIWEYDPATDTWNYALPNMSVGRRYVSAGVIGGKIYVAGGYNGSYLSSAEVFDPAVPGWSALPAMPSAWLQAADAVKHDRFLILAGGSATSTAASTNLVLAYDALLNQWAWLPVMNHALYGAEADGDGEHMWIVSGRLYEGGAYSYSPFTTRVEQCRLPACQVQTLVVENFEGTFPPADWDVVNEGGDCVWQRNDYWAAARPNYAGGDGFAADADSDKCGSGTTMNTSLLTPPLDLRFAVTATLSYMAAYNDIGTGGDYADTDIGRFIGAAWANLAHWDEDHSGYGPGELVALDLGPYAGFADTRARFHYTGTYDWWWLVDQVRVDACIAVPDVIVQPPELVQTLFVNETAARPLGIINAGAAPLNWTIDEGCGSPVPWLTLDLTSGTVIPYRRMDIAAAFDAGPVPGVFTTTLCLNSNDPDTPLVHVPVTLTVLGLPEIAVAPPELVQAQWPNQTKEQVLNISNIGTADVEWHIAEAPARAAETGATVPLVPRPDADTAPSAHQLSEPAALGDVLFDIDAGTAASDTQLLGVEFALGYYWVTGGNSGVDPNKLYKLDPTGALVASWDQPGNTGWGWRDLAFDGTYLYASDDSGATVKQIDPATGAPTGVTIPCPLPLCRALAYDPGMDHFWAANWDSIIYEFDRTGAVIHSFPPVGRATYGMGWDNITPGGPYLWLWSQDGVDCTNGFCGRASQVHAMTGTLTGAVFDGVPYSPGTQELAGGAAVIPNLVPGKLVLVAMHQASPDMIVGYELREHCVPSDLPWLVTVPPDGVTAPGAVTPVRVIFDSGGLAPGEYTGAVCVNSNDRTDPQVRVPVTLTVELPQVAASPASLSSTQYPDQLVTRTLTISNTGSGLLNWFLFETPAPFPMQASSVMPAGSVRSGLQADAPLTTMSPSAAGAVPVDPPANPDAVLWDQPPSTANLSTYANQDFEAAFDAYDIFVADDFANANGWSLTNIYVPGGSWNPGNDLTCANSLNWRIYNDYNATPGDPYGAGAFWSLSLPPASPQVVLTTGSGGQLTNVMLNLPAPLVLPPGHWWLVFYPQADFGTCGQYGRVLADTVNGYAGQVINPGGGFGFPSFWESIQSQFTWNLPQQDWAFRLEGDVLPHELVWLHENPLSGGLLGGESVTVDAVFDSHGVAPGFYSGWLGVASNDPANPILMVPVSLTVQAPAADVSVTLVDSPDPVYAGELLTYTATAANAGPAGTGAVLVTDTLPAGVTFVSASAGCSHAAGVVTCSQAWLDPGGSAVFSIVVRADAHTPGPIVNTVTVSAPAQDPNLANNAATASTVKMFRLYLPCAARNAVFDVRAPGKPR